MHEEVGEVLVNAEPLESIPQANAIVMTKSGAARVCGQSRLRPTARRPS